MRKEVSVTDLYSTEMDALYYHSHMHKHFHVGWIL